MSQSDFQLPTADAVRAALKARRSALAAAWDAAPDSGGGLLLVPSGLALPIEGSDQPYAFRAHDDHYYLSGARAPAQVLVYDPAAAPGWILFSAVADQDDRVWHGGTEALEERAARLGFDAVSALEDLGPWLAGQAGRPAALLGSRDILERPIGYRLHPGDLDILAFDADWTALLQERVTAGRRVKDEVELAYMRAAAFATRAGHLRGIERARAGMTERALQVEIEYAFQRAGAERPAYASIAVAGARCAVLHATPGEQLLTEGDLVLVDAGAEVAGYDSDVTRTWPVGAAFTAEQRALYDLVLSVQQTAIDAVGPGVEYRDIHMQAALGIAEGLVDFGLLKGRAESLVERDAHALFFPHGVGHLIGLATHDVGGWAEGRTRSDRPGLKYLRIDLPLAAGHVVTIEPGIYMIPALLEDPELRHKHHDDVNWARADAMLAFGGIRIEDDVLVTAAGREVLTGAIPKTPAELEALRR